VIRTVADHVRVHAARTPWLAAVVSLPEHRTLTYRELDTASLRRADRFAAEGLAVGQRVGVWMHSSIAYLEMYLALARAGLVIVPVNERYAGVEADHILVDADVSLLVVDDVTAPLVDGLSLPRNLVRYSGPDSSHGLRPVGGASAAGPAGPEPALSPDWPMGIVYTSGTTGRPKGAVLSHRSVVATNRSNALAYRLTERGIAVYGASMSFAGTVLGQILSHLYVGSTIVMTGTADPDLICGVALEHSASFVGMPPPLIEGFTAALNAGSTRLPALRTLLQSGGKVPPATLAELNAMLTGRLVLAWGMTEISGAAATATTRADMTGALAGRTDILDTVGRPVPGCSVRLGPPPDTSAADDPAGELVVRTRTLMDGYWRDDDATARAIRAGWYHTGDLGTVSSDGFVTVVDRRTDLVVSGGANIYPQEIEDVGRSLAGVRECAAVGLRHERWGQSLALVVVPESGSALTREMVQTHFRARLADFKKPTRVFLADALPRTIGGKVRRAAVRRAAEAGVYQELRGGAPS
jgi:acyl-CoA synthetase (AMP-forming)/AMP-acid ligase II